MLDAKRQRTDSSETSGTSTRNAAFKILVQNLPHIVPSDDDNGLCRFIGHEDVIDFFSTYGPCECLYLQKDGEDGCRLGENFAEIKFDNTEHAAMVWEVANNHGLFFGKEKLAVTLVSENTSLIDVLTDECLDYIFSMCNLHDKMIVEQVQKRWRDLSAQHWARQTTLDFDKESGSRSDFCKVLRRVGENLKCLSFPTTSIRYLLVIEEYCQNIESMKVQITYEQADSGLFFNIFEVMFESLQELLVLHVESVKAGFRFDFVDKLPEEMKHLIVEDTGNPRVTLCIQLSKLAMWNKLQLSKWTIGPRGLTGIKKWFGRQTEDVVTVKTDGEIVPLSRFKLGSI